MRSMMQFEGFLLVSRLEAPMAVDRVRSLVEGAFVEDLIFVVSVGLHEAADGLAWGEASFDGKGSHSVSSSSLD